MTLQVQPDETLTKAGFTCGASVSPNFANIQLYQNRAVSDKVYWDTGAAAYKLWKNEPPLGAAGGSPFTVNSATTNHLILGQAQAILADRFDYNVERVGGVGENYTPTISTSQVNTSLTQMTINFWTPTLTASETKDWGIDR